MCNERLTIEELTQDQLLRVRTWEDQSGVQVLELERNENDKLRPTLINGRQVDRDGWREVVRIGNRSCTGTIVGRNAVITAAHCGRNNSRSTLEVFKDGSLVRYNYRMFHHPRYRGQSNWDIAVLALDNDIEDVFYAIAGVNYNFRQGAEVDILGYGCTRPGGGGGNDGILRFGESRVVNFTGTDVITSHRPSGAALCFGDSGGPMFADTSDASLEDHNTLIAVNSKGNIRDTNYNLRLDYDGVGEWLESIANARDLEIYGVNAQPDEPDPNPDPDPDPDPNPDPQDPCEVWAQLAKQHRETALYWERQAEKYEQMSGNGCGGDKPNPPNDPSDDLFGL